MGVGRQKSEDKRQKYKDKSTKEISFKSPPVGGAWGGLKKQNTKHNDILPASEFRLPTK
jgi:hypothetical protein